MNNLEKYRQLKNYTYEVLGKKLGITRQHAFNLCNSKMNNQDKLFKYYDLLGDDFLNFTTKQSEAGMDRKILINKEISNLIHDERISNKRTLSFVSSSISKPLQWLSDVEKGKKKTMTLKQLYTIVSISKDISIEDSIKYCDRKILVYHDDIKNINEHKNVYSSKSESTRIYIILKELSKYKFEYNKIKDDKDKQDEIDNLIIKFNESKQELHKLIDEINIELFSVKDLR